MPLQLIMMETLMSTALHCPSCHQTKSCVSWIAKASVLAQHFLSSQEALTWGIRVRHDHLSKKCSFQDLPP